MYFQKNVVHCCLDGQCKGQSFISGDVILEKKGSCFLCYLFHSEINEKCFLKKYYQEQNIFQIIKQRCVQKIKKIEYSWGPLSSSREKGQKENHSRNLEFQELLMSLLDYALALRFCL